AKESQPAWIQAVLALEPDRRTLVTAAPCDDVRREVGTVHREVRLDRGVAFLFDERTPLDVCAAAKPRLPRSRELGTGRAIVEPFVASEHQRRERAAET